MKDSSTRLKVSETNNKMLQTQVGTIRREDPSASVEGKDQAPHKPERCENCESGLISLHTFFQRDRSHDHHPSRRRFGSQVVVLPQSNNGDHSDAKSNTAHGTDTPQQNVDVSGKPCTKKLPPRARNRSKDSCSSEPLRDTIRGHASSCRTSRTHGKAAATSVPLASPRGGNSHRHSRTEKLSGRTTHHHHPERTPVPYHSQNRQQVRAMLEKSLSTRTAFQSRRRLSGTRALHASTWDEDSILSFEDPSFADDSRPSHSSSSSMLDQVVPIRRVLSLDTPKVEKSRKKVERKPVRRSVTYDAKNHPHPRGDEEHHVHRGRHRKRTGQANEGKRHARRASLRSHSPEQRSAKTKTRSRSASPVAKGKKKNTKGSDPPSPSRSPSPQEQAMITIHKIRSRSASPIAKGKKNRNVSRSSRSPSPGASATSIISSAEQVMDASIRSHRAAELEGARTSNRLLENARDRRIDPEKLAAALEKGPAIHNAIANKIRNNPSLMEMFLLESSDGKDLHQKLDMIPSSHGVKALMTHKHEPLTLSPRSSSSKDGGNRTIRRAVPMHVPHDCALALPSLATTDTQQQQRHHDTHSSKPEPKHHPTKQDSKHEGVRSTTGSSGTDLNSDRPRRQRHNRLHKPDEGQTMPLALVQ